MPIEAGWGGGCAGQRLSCGKQLATYTTHHQAWHGLLCASATYEKAPHSCECGASPNQVNLTAGA